MPRVSASTATSSCSASQARRWRSPSGTAGYGGCIRRTPNACSRRGPTPPPAAQSSHSEYRLLRPDGGVSWVAGTASDVRDSDGALLGWVGVCVDMTERKRTEERLRDMFEHARDAIYTSDLEGRFTSANVAAERLTGYSREELLQMRVVDLIAPEDVDRARELMARRLAGTHHGITDIEMIRKDGSRLFVEISGRRVFRDSQPAGVEAIVRDVTAQHELQRRLEYQAFHDPLTGLPNGALLRDRLSTGARTGGSGPDRRSPSC